MFSFAHVKRIIVQIVQSGEIQSDRDHLFQVLCCLFYQLHILELQITANLAAKLLLLINYKAPYLQARPNYQNVPTQCIETLGHNILRTFGHHVAATCCDCDMLGLTNRPLLHGPGETTTTSCNIHKCCIKN